jgi:hypothetical protein
MSDWPVMSHALHGAHASAPTTPYAIAIFSSSMLFIEPVLERARRRDRPRSGRPASYFQCALLLGYLAAHWLVTPTRRGLKRRTWGLPCHCAAALAINPARATSASDLDVLVAHLGDRLVRDPRASSPPLQAVRAVGSIALRRMCRPRGRDDDGHAQPSTVRGVECRSLFALLVYLATS